MIAAAFSGSAILMRFITPPILDKLKKTVLLRFGVILAILVTASCIFTESIPSILVVRVLQGVGFGIVSTICASLAADILPDQRRGEGIGYFGMGNTAMVAISPAVGLFLIETSGFDAAFLAAASVQVFSVITLAFFRPDPKIIMPAPRPEKKLPFIQRYYDSSLHLQTVLLVLFGFTRCSEMNFVSLLAADQGIAHLSVYFIFQTSVSFTVRFFAGNLYDRKGHAWVIIPSCISFLCGLTALSLAHNLGVLLVGGFFNGAALGAMQPSMQTWTMSSVASEKRSVASAVYYNFYDIGITIGSVVLGYIASGYGFPALFRVTYIPTALLLIIYCFATRRHTRNRGD
jgi:MFS family permease